MSKRSIELLVEDIWESIEKIERYTEGMTQDSFQSDEKTTDAVLCNLAKGSSLLLTLSLNKRWNSIILMKYFLYLFRKKWTIKNQEQT